MPEFGRWRGWKMEDLFLPSFSSDSSAADQNPEGVVEAMLATPGKLGRGWEQVASFLLERDDTART